MSRKIAISLGIAVMAAFNLNAQKSENFFGSGRAVVSQNEMVDTTSTDRNKTTGGYTLFDLGVQVNRDDVIKASAILRIRNEFGGFFGDGVTFNFRQLRLEGTIGKIVKYEIGDLDVALTPYSIWNSDISNNTYESDLFAIKRSIINYENFYTDDNTWRMQGVNTYTTLKFDKGIDQLYIRGFGNRLIGSDNVSIPDRLLYGTRIGVGINEYLKAGINYVKIEDIALTIPDSNVIYNNGVFTADVNFEYPLNEGMKVFVNGEFGSNKFNTYKDSEDTTVEYTDGFFDFRAGVKKDLGGMELTASASYRQVGTYFNSPSAQTRRIYDNYGGSNLDVFPTYNDGTTSRVQTLYDRYSQESGLYNQTVSVTLMDFNPIYNNITPYGRATPNRSGFDIDVTLADTMERFEVSLNYEGLTEVTAENVEDKRSFSGVMAGASVNVHKFLGWNRMVNVGGSYRSIGTTRGDNVDLSTAIINLSGDVEVMGKLHLLAGYQGHQAEGTEFTLSRNEYNTVSETALPSSAVYDIKQGVTALGMKYDFSENAVFSVQYHMVKFEDGAALAEAFDLNQLYFIYNLKF